MLALYVFHSVRLRMGRHHRKLHPARHRSPNPAVPCVYTVEILDFGGQKDEYIQMLYDRTPTLPQRLRLGEGHIDNLWNNIAHRIVTR